MTASTTRYVSPEMTGAEDLDRYGQWQQTPEYGALWVPRSVAADWAPYTTGHWAWVRPWGWTWVDDAPWGFAPFHYGRWVYHRNAWCWAPGTYVARPVYAPALVAWIGGPRTSVSISVGAGAPVGWFPLAPREVYVPAYRASPRYVQQVNVTHVTNVTNITTIVNNRNGEADRRDFANRKYAHAVTFVPAEVMTRRQPVAPGGGALPQRSAGARAGRRQRPAGAGADRAAGHRAAGRAAPAARPAGAAAAVRRPRAGRLRRPARRRASRRGSRRWRRGPRPRAERPARDAGVAAGARRPPARRRRSRRESRRPRRRAAASRRAAGGWRHAALRVRAANGSAAASRRAAVTGAPP